MTNSSYDPFHSGNSIRQLPRDTVRPTDSFLKRNALAITGSAAIAVAAVVALAPKFSDFIANLDTKNLPPIERPAQKIEKPSYIDQVKQNGLLIVHASGPRLADIVGEIQSTISPGNREQAVATISLNEKNGFYVATKKDGVELQPLANANVQGEGVSIAFVKPTEPAVTARIKKAYSTVEISPKDLAHKDVLDLKCYLAKAGGIAPTKTNLKERDLTGGVVEIQIKDIYPATPENGEDPFHKERREVVTFLRESIGQTTFSQQVAVRGTHSTIASKITGTEDSSHLANLLESRVPKIIAGQEFTIDVTPVFETARGLTIYFGNSVDAERFKNRFFPSN